MKKDKQEGQWKLLTFALKKIAEKKGLKNKEIAEKMGVFPNNISRTFSCCHPANLKSFAAICDAANVGITIKDEDGIVDVEKLILNIQNNHFVFTEGENMIFIGQFVTDDIAGLLSELEKERKVYSKLEYELSKDEMKMVKKAISAQKKIKR